MTVIELPAPTEAERVAAGAALLDAAWADAGGWAHLINPETLRLVNSCRCVLGQLYGDYWDGIVELDLAQAGGAPAGFFVAGPATSPSPGDEWARLRALWLAEIERRLP